MARTLCAIYTRKSSEEGLEQDFNSLDAQREACAAYIASQRHEGWVLVKERYDDGGLSDGHLDRPALQRLMDDVEAGRVNRIVVYKIDRLTRSLTDFAKLVERLDGAGASFVSVTQSFNTATSMGRLTLNVLLSFAQFEREVTAERIRDKIAASKKKGLWMGGNVPLGYEAEERTLRVVPEEAETVRLLSDIYEELGTVTAVTKQAAQLQLRSKRRTGRDGSVRGGTIMGRGQIHHLLSNPVCAGRIRHKDLVHEGQHELIIKPDRFDAIQARLMDKSAKKRAKPAAIHLSPLAGKLFDETDDRLTPAHASKAGKRYRYYISRRFIAGAGGDAGTGWRLPADRLERDLGRAVPEHLITSVDRGDIGIHDAGSIPGLRSHVEALGDGVLDCIDTVRLGNGMLRVDLNMGNIADLLSIAPTCISSECLSFCRPFSQWRRGVEKRLIIGATQPADLHLASISGGTDIVSCFVTGDPTRPVYRGELQCPGFGLAVDVRDDDGNPAGDGEKGELVCIAPFPSMPLGFWGDESGEKYKNAYFTRFPGIWCQGDFAERRSSGGFVIHGRSDATLNPGGVRIGTAEIYAEVEKFPQVREAVVIGQDIGDDVRVVLFVTMAEGEELTEVLVKNIKSAIRAGSSPRHVPAVVLAVEDIPRTKSGKITELAVCDVVHGRGVKNTDSLANPEALDHFRDLPELQIN